MPDTVDLHAARRALRNFRAMVRRPSNWAGTLEGGYQRAFYELVRLEDRYGVDAIPVELTNRLRDLRIESGISPEAINRAERNAIRDADHYRAHQR